MRSLLYASLLRGSQRRDAHCRRNKPFPCYVYRGSRGLGHWICDHQNRPLSMGYLVRLGTDHSWDWYTLLARRENDDSPMGVPQPRKWIGNGYPIPLHGLRDPSSYYKQGSRLRRRPVFILPRLRPSDRRRCWRCHFPEPAQKEALDLPASRSHGRCLLKRCFGLGANHQDDAAWTCEGAIDSKLC